MTDYEIDRYYAAKWVVPEWCYFVFGWMIVAWLGADVAALIAALI